MPADNAPLRRRGRGALLLTLAVVLALTTGPAAGADSGPGSGVGGPHPVRTAEYSLGDTAFHVPGFQDTDADSPADIELTGVVHYPADIGVGEHPLVMLSHGQWQTCADRRAGSAWEKAFERLHGPNQVSDPDKQKRLSRVVTKASTALNRWPCASGVPSLPSYRGYDYLGRQLARHGFVAVSISANGVNAGPAGQAQDRARAALINKHLRLWQRLSSTGGGPLARRLVGENGWSRADAFPGHVDMHNVATIGHSRGGRGVMWQAADAHRDSWPPGVRVKAAVALAPATYYTPDGSPEADYRVTDIPYASLGGSCDADVGLSGPKQYFDDADDENTTPAYEFIARGANHDYFNTQWSPSSHQVMAHDDVHQHRFLGPDDQLPPPGRCVAEDTGHERQQLSEREQRRFAGTYISAFLLRHLDGRTELDPTLNGRAHPLAGLAEVRVAVKQPS